MTRDTAELIHRLTTDSSAVPPLARPWTRAATWCAWSLSYLVLFDLVWPHPAFGIQPDRRFIVEQAAALATGLAAAVAAFATVVPGHSRALVLVPVLPLGVWVGSIGQRCAGDWATSAGAPAILMHWACFPLTVLAGALPAMAIVVMLRRGAPLTPRLTTAVAGIAVAGLSNFGIRFVHPFDASFVVLAWHVIAVFGLSAAAAVFAPHIFSWRKAIAASDVSA
jgi:hypothetical protein